MKPRKGEAQGLRGEVPEEMMTILNTVFGFAGLGMLMGLNYTLEASPLSAPGLMNQIKAPGISGPSFGGPGGI